MEKEFLGHYLATTLDAEAWRLDPGIHDFSAYDPDPYLPALWSKADLVVGSIPSIVLLC